MARALHFEYPGAFYHVMNRGNAGDEYVNWLKESFLFKRREKKKFHSFAIRPRQILRKGAKRDTARDVTIYLAGELSGKSGVDLVLLFIITVAY
jgi:hypothetical protein